MSRKSGWHLYRRNWGHDHKSWFVLALIAAACADINTIFPNWFSLFKRNYQFQSKDTTKLWFQRNIIRKFWWKHFSTSFQNDKRTFCCFTVQYLAARNRKIYHTEHGLKWVFFDLSAISVLCILHYTNIFFGFSQCNAHVITWRCTTISFFKMHQRKYVLEY